MFKIYILVFFLFFSSKLNALNSNIDIKYKIGDEIITNIDIQDEKNYLLFLRPKLSSLPKKELLKISENSLIKEIIKKKELKKVFKNIKNKDLTEDIKKSIFNYKNVKSEEEFINCIKGSPSFLSSNQSLSSGYMSSPSVSRNFDCVSPLYLR